MGLFFSGVNMGTDIHPYIERLRQGVWVPVNPTRKYPRGATKDRNHPAYEATKKDFTDWARWLDDEDEDRDLEVLSQSHEEDPAPFRAAQWNFGRNYDAFGYLAGVRRDGPPFIEPRGIPRDLSKAVQSEWENGGDHTPSWYTAEELKGHVDGVLTVEEEEDRDWGLKRIQELFQVMVEIAEKHKLTLDEVRVVFWFDS